jgi:hypothetical protein
LDRAQVLNLIDASELSVPALQRLLHAMRALRHLAVDAEDEVVEDFARRRPDLLV